MFGKRWILERKKENMNQSDDHSQLLILELDVETLETSNTTINFSIF